MAFIDSDDILRLEKDRALRHIQFQSTAVEALSIDLFADKPLIAETSLIKPHELKAWIDKESCPIRPEKSLGALRLVLGRSSSDDSNIDGLFPADRSKRKPLPFSRDQFDLLCDKFHLPITTAGMLACGTVTTSYQAHFQVYTTNQANNAASNSHMSMPDRVGITMRLPPSSVMGMWASLALSYSRSSNVTHAVLFCNSSAQTAHITDAIARVPAISTHPGFLPALLCNLGLELLDTNAAESWQHLFRVEAASGQTGIYTEAVSNLSTRENCADPSLSRKAIAVAQLALAWEAHSGSCLEILSKIRDFMASLDATATQANVHATEKRQRQAIKEYISLAYQRGHSLRQSVRHLKGRADLQVTTIYNYLAQRNNEINLNLAESSHQRTVEAQKDTAAMKSIAVLAMTFIPATYIASLSASPAMASFHPSHGIFWVATLLLTLFVLTIWAGWTILVTRQIDRSATLGPSRSEPRRCELIATYVDVNIRY